MHTHKLDDAKKLQSQRGYTLIEIAVVMLVVGIFVAAAVPLYKMYVEKTKYEDTKITQKEIDAAMTGFKNLRGRYPCPSPYTATPTTPLYGEEVMNCAALVVPPGTCSGGLCFELSQRSILVNGVTVTPIVIRGALPYHALDMREDQSYDQYGGKFSYAVTALLTDKNTFNVVSGGISVVDGQQPPVSMVHPVGSAQYFIFSHGPDGVGAFSKQGVQETPCNYAMFDNENCNTTTTNPDAKFAVYRHVLKSEEAMIFGNAVLIPGSPAGNSVNTHYDDIASYVGIGQQPMWEMAEDGFGNTKDTMNLHKSMQKKVIIGKDAIYDETGPRSNELMLQVEGIPAAEGIAKSEKVRVEQICDPGSTDCMPPSLLAAQPYPPTPADLAPQSLQCDDKGAAKYPVGVNSKKIICKDLPPAVCETGEYLNGFDASGEPICIKAGVKCDEKIVKICSVNQVLPVSKSGTVITLTGGASYSIPYTCNAGKWKAGTASGVCTCTPSSTSNTTASCGANMTGNITTTTTTVCPSGQKTTTQTGNTCQCAPSTTSNTTACGPGQTGNTTTITTVSCTGGAPVTTTTQGPSNCACAPETQTKSVNCPTGFNGKIQQESVKACPSGTWSAYTQTGHNCTCKTPTTTTKACPSAYNSGSIKETCGYTCNMSALTATQACTTDNTCACIPTSNVTYKACPAGKVGNIKVTTEVKCPGAATKVTEDDTGCVDATVSCKMVAVGPALSNSKQKWADGDTCTMKVNETTCTSVKYCHKVLGPNIYATHSCNCE